ncbi:MAG: dTDP-4-dehydrorhamnose reductase [Bryobacteraceae bacterium]|nr:dTDP-4-dehydrorhamnose reductase [Bryobacteraceae bacterium]
MTKSVLIFGAAGQLGVELVREFTARRAQVHPFTRRQIDLTDGAQVQRAIEQTQPDLVLNAAAYNMVDLAEQDPAGAYAVNALAVRSMAVACRQFDAKFVHFSTDYVFDGQRRVPYTENDPTHPLGAYAVSKLAGELYAQAYLDALVIRTAVVFGPGGRATPRGNFVETMLKKAEEQKTTGKPLLVVNDQTASPTYAPWLAARTADLVDLGQTGVFHGGGEQAVTFYDYAQLIFRAAKLEVNLQPADERQFRTPARRPKYSVLRNERMRALGLAPMPNLENLITEYLQGQ